MRRLRQQAEASARASHLIPETTNSTTLLDRVSFRWPNGRLALDSCSLSIPSPGLWMLVGSNGSGKSTLFRVLAGLLEVESGHVLSDYRAALVFQNPDHQLLDAALVPEQLDEPRDAHARRIARARADALG